MSDIIVFVPKNIEHMQEITDLLRMHNIKTTDSIQDATIILTTNNLKNNLENLALLLQMEEQRINTEHKLEIIPRVIEPFSLQETNKKTYTKYQVQKNFNGTKQIMYKSVCFNRGRKR